MLTIAFRDHIFFQVSRNRNFSRFSNLCGTQWGFGGRPYLVFLYIIFAFLYFCVFLYFSDLCRPESGEEARAAHRGWAPLLKASAAAASPLKQPMEN